MRKFGVLCTRVIAIAIMATLATGCMQSYERGQNALLENDYNSAQQFARQGLDENRNHAESNLLMAQALSGQKRYSDALPYAQKAIRANHLKPEAGRTLGKIYWELGRALEAVDAWKIARSENIKSVRDDDYQRALEAALALANSRRDAEAAYNLRTELKTLDENHPEATDELLRNSREELARALVQQGRLEDAVTLYKDLAKTQSAPEKQSPYELELGTLLLRLDRLEDATNAWQQSVEHANASKKEETTFEIARRAESLNAHSIAAHFLQQALASMQQEASTFRRATLQLHLARLAMRTDDPTSAKTHLHAYLHDMRELNGSPLNGEIYRTAANTAAENNHPELAIELLEDAAEQALPSWPVAQELAELYARRGRAQDVERTLTRFAERAENPAEAEANAARWAIGRRNFELAKFFMERAAARPQNAQNAQNAQNLQLELARIYAELSDDDQLEITLDTYVRSNPNNIEALISAAELYQAKTFTRKAENTLKSALRLDPKSNRVTNLLAQIYIATDRPNELRPLYDAWLRANGNNPRDILQTGASFEQQNDLENALHYYNRAAQAGNNQAWLFSADIYRAQQRNTEMKAALEQYIKTAPVRRIALQDALERYNNRSTDDTIRTLQELIALAPQEWPHNNTLANLYIQQNRQQDAFTLLENYIAASPNQTDALNNIARNFQSPNTVAWLLTFYQRLLDADPDQPALLRLIGDAHLQVAYANQLSGDSQSHPMQQAQKYYLQYLEIVTPRADELREFAAGMRSNNLWPIAAQAYQRLLSKFPPSGQVLLQYGESLLQLGQIQKAEESFATHFEMRGKTPADAHTIARHLLEFKRYRAAEPYLQTLFQSDKQEHIQVAFSSLTEIYRDTDRAHEISPLINQFLAKSQNPTRARRLVLTLLENSGMWQESVEQLKRMRDLRDDSVNFELATNTYRAGNPDEAREFFDRFAANSPEPADAWLAIAQFYDQHAQTDDAISAYNQALALNSRHPEALAQRGRFHILNGNVPAGINDFNNAAENATLPDQQTHILAQLVELLEETGHFPQALQISRHAITKNPTINDVFLRQIAHHELATNDPARLNAAITNLRSEGIDLLLIVELLRYFGHPEQAIQLLQQELETGDQDTAANAILINAHIFVETGGTQRLINAVQPLLTPPRVPDANILAMLGQHLIHYQQPQRGAQYLQAAVDLGATQYIPMLAHTHLLLGNQQEALALFQTDLHQKPDPQNRQFSTLQNDLAQLAIRFELAKKTEHFTNLLHFMFTQKDYAHAAAPALVHEIIAQANSPQPVFELLQNSPWMPTPNNTDPTSLNITRQTLQTVANHGFILETQTFLAELPQEIRQQKTITELTQNLQNLSSTTPETPQNNPDSPQNNRTTALETNTHARLLMIHGQYQQAQQTARPQLNSPDTLVARDTLEILLSIARASAQDQSIDEIVQQYLANSEDKQSARAYAAEQLSRLGYDHAATQLKSQNARIIPTETNILSAIIAAHNTGDTKTIENLSKSYWRIAQTPANTAQRLASELRANTEIQNLAPLLEPAAHTIRAFPTAYLGIINREFSLGNIETARQMLLETLQSYDFEPRLTELVLTELNKYKLHVEAARFLAPHIQNVPLTRLSHRHLGFANLALNLTQDAQKHFDTYIQQSSDPAYAAAELSALLLNQKQYPQALHYAQQAIETHTISQNYSLPLAHINRDIALLATQKTDQPQPTESLSKGYTSPSIYTQFAQAALAANNPEAALPFIEKIITAPTHDLYATIPLQRVLDIFNTPEFSPLGAEFLQQNYPRIASGNFDPLNTNIVSLASLYDSAGRHQQVQDLYQSAILAELIRNPLSNDLTTFLNNLAYMYSTTNTNIDLGLDMARRAIAASPTRSPYLLDTLGWLQFRNGQINEAESIIRRALRSSDAPAYQHAEYYSHLAELLQLQGHHQQAIWLQILRDRTQ